MAHAKNSKRPRSGDIANEANPEERSKIIEECDMALDSLSIAIYNARVGQGMPAVWKLSISATNNGFFSDEELNATEVHGHQILRRWLDLPNADAWKAIAIVKVGSVPQRPAVFFLTESPFGEARSSVESTSISKLEAAGISITMSSVSGANPLAGLMNDRLKEDVECLNRAMNAKKGVLSLEAVKYAMRVKECTQNIREVLDTLEDMYEI